MLSTTFPSAGSFLDLVDPQARDSLPATLHRLIPTHKYIAQALQIGKHDPILSRQTLSPWRQLYTSVCLFVS